MPNNCIHFISARSLRIRKGLKGRMVRDPLESSPESESCSSNLHIDGSRGAIINLDTTITQRSRESTMISGKSTINAEGRVKLAIFLICLVGGIELTLASRSCKRTVMKILAKQCGSEAEIRSRRATEDGEKKDMWQSLVAEMLPTTVNGINKIVGDNLETFLDKVLLILKDSLTSIITGQSNTISTDEQHRQRRGSPMLEKSAPLATTGGPMYKLTINEVEDLYAEIFKGPHRRPSMTPDKAKALLINIAAKCCRNVDTCLRKKIIDCP